jgi:hypothetical protein
MEALNHEYLAELEECRAGYVKSKFDMKIEMNI